MSGYARPTSIRHGFSRRLRQLRQDLGMTQAQMAAALGISTARYSKYEIARSEAPYAILLKISRLTGASLDQLVGGAQPGRRADVAQLVAALPIAAVVYDEHNAVYAANRRYRRGIFAKCPGLVRRGTPQPLLLRAWAYSHGHGPEETERFVRERLAHAQGAGGVHEVRIGPQSLRIVEARVRALRLVLITDVGP